jgi:hypothetical protein
MTAPNRKSTALQPNSNNNVIDGDLLTQLVHQPTELQQKIVRRAQEVNQTAVLTVQSVLKLLECLNAQST